MSLSDVSTARRALDEEAKGNPTAAPSGGSLLRSELTVLFRRGRTLAMLGALAAIPIMIALAIKLSPARLSAAKGPPFLDQVSNNGLFLVVTALLISLPLFLPLTIGVVAGDTIAGEASLGTLRYLLIAPAGRIRLLLVKYAGVAAFCFVGTAVVAITGTLVGLAFFPVGRVTLLSGDTVGIGEAIGRLSLVSAFVFVSLLGLSAIGLFISTLTVVPVGAMAATVVMSVVVQILDALPQLGWLHPWLFSHYWIDFADLLRQPMSFTSFGENALLQLGYIVVFGALAIGRFASKDVLS